MNNNIVPICCVNRDGKVAGPTLWLLTVACIELQRIPLYFSVSGTGFLKGLNSMVESLKQAFPGRETVRAIWFEEDIFIEPNERNQNLLKQGFSKADENNWNLVSNYHLFMGTQNGQMKFTNSYFHKSPLMSYSDNDVRTLQPFDIVEMAGLGFYYGEVSLNYSFHESGGVNDVGADFWFHADHNHTLRHLPLSIQHWKPVVF